MAPILATWCPDVLQDNGSSSDPPCRPSGPRRSSLLAFITRGMVRNDVRDDDLHLTRRSIPPATIILRCVLPGAFSAPRVMRATRSCAPRIRYDRVRLYRVAVMDISNMLRLTRDPVRRCRQSSCSETTVRLGQVAYLDRYLFAAHARCYGLRNLYVN